MTFGWLGNALIIAGAWNIGCKRRWGFLLSISGGCCWALEGLLIGKADLVFIESVMLLVALRNYIKWGGNG